MESFQAGATISLPNQILKDTSTGEYYRWDGSLPKVVPAGSTPSSTGGTGVGAWISVGDSALRSMLAANDGEKLIGECPTIAILRTIEPTVDKQRITLKEHTAGTRKGGGQFRAVLNGAAYTDNNGTVIKTAGGSAWLRINADILNPLMFGAIGDGVANDAAAVNSALATGVSVNLVGLTYLTSGTPIRMDVITGRQELYGGIIKDGSVGNNNILSVGGTNKTVRNLTIDGTSGPTSRGIIVKENSADILISQCVIKECKYYAIAASYDYVNKTRCQRINVDRCWIDHCGQLGTGGGSGGASSILFDQVFTSSVTNCDLTRCNWGISWLQPFTPPAASEPFGYYNRVANCRITGSGLNGNLNRHGFNRHLRVI